MMGKVARTARSIPSPKEKAERGKKMMQQRVPMALDNGETARLVSKQQDQDSDSLDEECSQGSLEGLNDTMTREEFSFCREKNTTIKRNHLRPAPLITCVIGSWPLLIVSVALFVVNIVIFWQERRIASSLPEYSSKPWWLNGNNNRTRSVLYGHVHIPKTAGTTINGELSMHYERVCGNKGYSYDSYQTNLRFQNSKHHDLYYKGDSISALKEGFNRGRVPAAIVHEIGFEDCDYVSQEGPWDKRWTKFEYWDEPVELHVPCREPVDHLMSQCNYKNITFDCQSDKDNSRDLMLDQVKGCLMGLAAYSKELETSYKNIHVRCFSFTDVSRYLEYMGERLQRKRVQADYVFRESNKPRHGELECIWNHPEEQELITKFLVETYDYYNFCDRCLASKHDLLV